MVPRLSQKFASEETLICRKRVRGFEHVTLFVGTHELNFVKDSLVGLVLENGGRNAAGSKDLNRLVGFVFHNKIGKEIRSTSGGGELP